MNSILVSGVGMFGGWVVELLARAPGVDRIVSIDRMPTSGPSRTTMAMIGSTLQGHTKSFEHHQIELADTERLADLLRGIEPAAIIHSATVQSPRQLMHANIGDGLRDTIRRATFSMWLPWQLLPASLLMQAVERSGITTQVINASFPDVVNVALWNRFGYGPRTGAGNVEVCAAWVLRYAMEATGAPADRIQVSLVGSHALLTKGAQVPHDFRLQIGGRDVTDEHNLDVILTSWPQPTDWTKVDIFSPFAASAVKNALALIGDEDVDTHVTAPDGLPGGYPATIGSEGIHLRLPQGLARDEAVAINHAAARWDGIDRIEDDGTVVYTESARSAMAELGYECEAVTFEDLDAQRRRLQELYDRLTP